MSLAARRRVTLASLVSGLTGAVVLESWKLGVVVLCGMALGWILTRGTDAVRDAKKGDAPPGV